ncbi:MAG TPA: YHS domain-containing protein [Gemmataceae bacterium]|jgi:hypothetical protein|nr:YHS domain-containing protein [Gemmataceae bacterium]
MHHVRLGLTVLLALGTAAQVGAAEKPAKRSPRDALRAFNELIGPWRGTGIPEGTRDEKQRGFWSESITWRWQFKKDDAWLQVKFAKGKHFTSGQLHYLPDRDLYRLELRTAAKETLVFDGPLKDRRLTLERTDAAKKETQRLTLTLLHETRFLYDYEVKPRGRSVFTRLYQVGATRTDVAFAGAGDDTPECVVTGGLGKIAVTYKGRTYYVCCTGCRDAFKEDPEKYVKEYEQKAKAAREKVR